MRLSYITRMRLRKLKETIKILLRSPRKIARVVNWNLYWMNYVKKKYPEYSQGLPVIDPSAITKTFDTIDTRTYNEGSSLEIALFKAIACEYKYCRFLEIGTLYGDAVVNVADVAETCVTVDIKEPEYPIGKLIKDVPNIEMVTANSYEMDWHELGWFDFIFIDGGKTYELTLSDVSNALQVLFIDGTIIMHDYVWFSDYYDTEDAAKYEYADGKFRYMGVRWELLAAVLDAIYKKTRPVNIYYIANTRCLIITNTTYPEWDGLDGIYEIDIRYTGERI